MTIGGTWRVIGGLFTGSLLDRIAAGDPKLPGTTPESYHQETSAELNQAIHRSWLVLTGRWASFQMARNGLPEGDRATALTRDKWLLPLFTELGYGRLPAERPVEIDGRSFPVSHRWAHAPIHLIGAGESLDRPYGKARGTPSPHGLVQDLLNSAEDRLWGLLSNGLQLRLLRDHRALTRQAFVEFDLESIFDEEAYSAFRVLWLLCHQSRVEGDAASDCWLERWFQVLRDDGVPAMERMREGVEQALVHLGNGFLRHRDNAPLFARLSSGDLSSQDYYRQLLRLAYRLIFLLVAERRGLLLDPAASPEAHERYSRMYAIERLRLLANKRRGGGHGDSWIALRLVMRELDRGCPGIALPGLGSFLWRTEALPDLDPCSITNEDLFAAVRALCEIQDGPVRRPLDWASVQSDELGSIYEALMERVPQPNLAAASFALTNAGGSERKTTGSYYTPSSLVDCLLDSALDPVLDEACATPDPEAAILNLAVVDPACGSGHFLVAAARRIAVRLARLRSSGVEPSPPDVQHALREVVSRCIYGVDINPMAVELCKVSLWMEALEPGRPLSFLDAHIRCGNALIGATSELMAKGIPDRAWEFIEGDDKEVSKRLKKANRESAQGALFGAGSGAISVDLARTAAAALARPDAFDDTTREAIGQKERAFREAEASGPVQAARLLADLWCAAFVWPKTVGDGETFAPTKGVWDRLKSAPLRVPERMQTITGELRKRHGFFHWHLAFPIPTARDGFDLVLGNPPWERVNLEAKQFFSGQSEEIASAGTTQRRALLANLRATDTDLWGRYTDALRQSSAEIAYFQNSGVFPRLNQARLNTYLLFTERAAAVCSRRGRCGLVVPTGIATDEGSRHVFAGLIGDKRLLALWDFENRTALFPGVHRSYRFCLLTLTGAPGSEAQFAFGLHSTRDIDDDDRCWALDPQELTLLSPVSGLCPTFGSKRSRDVVLAMYRRVPTLFAQQLARSDWGMSDFLIMFRSDDSDELYRTPEQLVGVAERSPPHLKIIASMEETEHVPVWESKLIHQFDHRYATFGECSALQRRKGDAREVAESSKDAVAVATPRHWVPSRAVRSILSSRRWERDWYAAYRDITNATNERTAIAAILPANGAAQPLNIFLPESALHACIWVGAMNSMAIDFVIRNRITGIHLNITMCRQLPMVHVHGLSSALGLGPLISARCLELTYTSAALSGFARDLGYSGPPFRWEPSRRALLRAELDAAFFHLYGLSRDETAYVLDTFPIVRKRDEKAHGEYRTKRMILAIYDAMVEAARADAPYRSPLAPPPADPAMLHRPQELE